MRTLKTFIVVFFASFMLSACGGGSPESVAEKFQQALMDGDFEKAGKYATGTTAPLLKAMGSMLPADQLKELRQETKGAKVKIVSSEVDGDRATVTMEITRSEGEVEEMEYKLVKEEGSWKVEFEK